MAVIRITLAPQSVSKHTKRSTHIIHNSFVRQIIGTVSATCRSYMRTMHFWPVRHHVLMHHTTQQRITTQLIRLSKPHLLRQKVHTSRAAVILHKCAVTILCGYAAYTLSKGVCYRLLCCGGTVDTQIAGRDREESVNHPFKSAEGSVVLLDLAGGVEGTPYKDYDGEAEIEGGIPEGEAHGHGSNVFVCGKLEDFVGGWETEEGD